MQRCQLNLVRARLGVSCKHKPVFVKSPRPWFLLFSCVAQGPLPPRLGDAWRLPLPAVLSPGAYVLACYGGANPFHAAVRLRVRLAVGGLHRPASGSRPVDPAALVGRGSAAAAANGAAAAHGASADLGASDVVIDVGEARVGEVRHQGRAHRAPA
jgi:hypothetical protein